MLFFSPFLTSLLLMSYCPNPKQCYASKMHTSLENCDTLAIYVSLKEKSYKEEASNIPNLISAFSKKPFKFKVSSDDQKQADTNPIPLSLVYSPNSMVQKLNMKCKVQHFSS